VPLVARAWGAPLGQPFADDFHFLHHALFRPGGWLDGGGAVIYWRPLSRQAYFGLLAPLLLATPWVVALLHAAVLGLASLLLHRTWRSAWPGPWAAAAASFPLLAESSRSLLLWPSAFQDLGALAFSAVALHEASRRRLRTALPALAAALLCKEIAVVTALLLPWVPGSALERRERGRWALGAGATVLTWGVAYAFVMRGAGLMFQRHLEAPPPPLAERLAWALASSLGDAFGLGAATGATASALGLAAAALVALALGAAAISAAGRARLRTAAPWVAWGLAWFLANASTLTEVHPVWGPFRSAFGMVGLGVALVGLMWGAGPAWLAALVAGRLTALALAPGPPADIAPAPYREQASLDFASLTRLSRLAAATERALRSRHPSLPQHGVVMWHQRARLADHAFAGDKSLQVWYRDTTLSMAWWEDVSGGEVARLDAVLEFGARGPRQVVTVEPRAMASYLGAVRAMEAGDGSRALGQLARADSLQADRDAKVFLGRVAGKRAVCLLGDQRLGAARGEAERSLALWPEGGDSRYVLAVLLAVEGRVPAARAQLDTLLALYPFDASARQLRDSLNARAP
jgi:hypothetical protein